MLADMMTALEAARERLLEKEDELVMHVAQALTAFTEVSARLQSVQDELQKTNAALAVMRGEVPVQQEAKTADSHTDVAPASSEIIVTDEAPPTAPAAKPGFYNDGTPHKKGKRRPDGPFAGIECSGCGEIGSLYESRNSKGIRIIGCSACKATRPG